MLILRNSDTAEGGNATTEAGDTTTDGVETQSTTETGSAAESQTTSTETSQQGADEGDVSTETEGDIDFNSFLGAKDGVEQKTETTATTTDGGAKGNKQQQTQTTTQQQTQKQGEKQTLSQRAAALQPRDYTGIAPEHKGHFERMSNDAFAFMKGFYQQALKDKADLAAATEKLTKAATQPGALPESYSENPQAYILSKEYGDAVQAAQLAGSITEHWRTQLDAVRAGAKEYVGLVNDPQTGQLRYTGKLPVDERTQSLLERNFYTTTQQEQRFQGRLEAIASEHKTRHTSAMADLRQYESQTFKVFEDPNHPLQPQIKDAIQRIHPAFRSSPLTPLLAKSLIALTVVTGKYAALLKQQSGKGGTIQQTAKTRTANAQRLAGPNASGAGSGGEGKEEDVTMDDFENVKNR